MRSRSVLLLILLAACSGTSDGGGVANTVTRDSAGIAIREYPVGAIDDAPEWTLSSAPLAIIGDDSLDSALDLSTATLGGILSDGRVVVSTARPAQLTVFGTDGAQIGTLGRAGEGPGEYRFIAQVLVLPGDTVLAFEIVRRKGILFAPDGALISEVDFPLSGDRPVAPMMRGRLGDGTFVMSGETEIPLTPEGNEKVYRMDLPIFALRAEATRYDTVTVTQAAQNYRSSVSFGGQTIPVSRPVGFGASPQVAMTRTGFWLATGEAADIREFVVSGATLPASPRRIVRFDQPRREVTEADRARFVEQATENLERVGGVVQMPEELLESEVAKLKETIFASAFPAIGLLRTDPAGRLWMSGGSLPGDSATTWTVLDAEGAPIGRITLPEGTIFAVSGDRVVMRREDPITGLVRLEVWGVVVDGG